MIVYAWILAAVLLGFALIDIKTGRITSAALELLALAVFLIATFIKGQL